MCIRRRRTGDALRDQSGRRAQRSLTYRYHDTFPKPDFIPQWPAVKDPWTTKEVDSLAEAGQLFGTPDRIIENIRRYEEIGIDGICIGVGALGEDHALETLEFFGKHIIPAFDRDPGFRTDTFRYADRGTGSGIIGSERGTK